MILSRGGNSSKSGEVYGYTYEDVNVPLAFSAFRGKHGDGRWVEEGGGSWRGAGGGGGGAWVGMAADAVV